MMIWLAELEFNLFALPGGQFVVHQLVAFLNYTNYGMSVLKETLVWRHRCQNLNHCLGCILVKWRRFSFPHSTRSLSSKLLTDHRSSSNQCFNQPAGYLTYQNLEELLIKAANKEDYTKELGEVVSFYGDDFDDNELCTELDIFSSSFIRKNEQ